MSLFDRIRNEVSKRRKPPKRIRISAADYDILQVLHLAQIHGDQVVINSTGDPDQQYLHAQILHDNFDYDRYELLEETGFWVDE